MFIVKDKRRVEEILFDDADSRESLKLQKRKHEFTGTLEVLTKQKHVRQLHNLKSLNLYDNELSSLAAVENLAQTPLETLNLGCNLLKGLPIGFGALKTLRSLWLDENYLEDFPITLCSLTNLEELRLSKNNIKKLPQQISALSNMVTFACDNNKLEEFPLGVIKMTKLKHLWLRQNKIQSIPDDIDALTELETLSAASNQLTILPESLCSLKKLQAIYLNSNALDSVPIDLVLLPKLSKLNLANNELDSLPFAWTENWGKIDKASGTLQRKSLEKGPEDDEEDGENNEANQGEPPQALVNVSGNPVLKESAYVWAYKPGFIEEKAV